MNLRLLSILAEKPDFPIQANDMKILEFFVEYLDHGSLWMFRMDIENNEPVFVFTNEAQHYRFTLSQIRNYYNDMKSGIAMDWENIPFEYIAQK